MTERAPRRANDQDTELSSQAKRTTGFEPTPTQWAALGIEPVATKVFRSEHATEGKISINEDHATPIYPPYAGRVTRLMAKPGDAVEARRAAVLHRSRRHGAGAERFPRRARRRSTARARA